MNEMATVTITLPSGQWVRMSVDPKELAQMDGPTFWSRYMEPAIAQLQPLVILKPDLSVKVKA